MPMRREHVCTRRAARNTRALTRARVHLVSMKPRRVLRDVLVTALVPAALAVFLPWQLQWDALRDLVAHCRVSAGCNANHTWFDFLASLSAPPGNPAGAEVARNVVHTLHLVATLWFAHVIAPQTQTQPAHGPLYAWLGVLVAMLLQPAVHTSTRTQLRPEPPFSDSMRALFPAAYADAPDIVFALDPPTLMGVFLAVAITRAHRSAAAWLIGTSYAVGTLLYAISLRSVSTPSLALTALSACALASLVAPHTRRCRGDDGDEDGVGGGGGDDEEEDTDADDVTLLSATGLGDSAVYEIGGSLSDDDDDFNTSAAARRRRHAATTTAVIAERPFGDVDL